MLRTRIAVAAAALFLVTMIPSASQASGPSGGPFGLGVILNGPTGLTGKYWISDANAIDFHLGLHGLGNRSRDDFGLYGDYLFNFDLGVNNSVISMPLYVGPGLGLIFVDGGYCDRWGRCYDNYNDDLYVQVRAPLGLSFLFKKFPGEAFIELVTELWLTPFTDVDIDAALGFRFYF